MAKSTGQGTTVAFTTAGSITCARSITLPEWSMEVVDASCISSTGFMEKLAGDLTDGGEVQIVAALELSDDLIAPTGTADTITVTLPSAGLTSSILTGTGYVTSVTMPSIEINGLLEQTITFTFDGGTGPTWTPGT